MIGVTVFRMMVGGVVIVAIFALFAVLAIRARRSHTRKVGGRSYWDIIWGDRYRLRKR
ncbi:MAG TPA: hypothetical protein VM243_04000 [Phycisphaerae bacterium]|nr:hypothetical protein [Phycisphaerae bacterium]